MKRYKGFGDYLRTGGNPYQAPSFGGGKETPEEYDARRENQRIEREQREREYQERERERESNARKMEVLISRANSISNSTDWKKTKGEMSSLMAEWKQIGSPGKNRNDQLWNQFHSARQHFFDAMKQDYEKRKREYDSNAREKRTLIEKARQLSAFDDHIDNRAQEAKQLRPKWKAIGFAGRDSENKLWAEFNDALNSFWSSYKQRKNEIYEERNKLKQQIQHEAELIENISNVLGEAKSAYNDLKMMSFNNREVELIAHNGSFLDKPFNDFMLAELGVAVGILTHIACASVGSFIAERKEAAVRKRELIDQLRGGLPR